MNAPLFPVPRPTEAEIAERCQSALDSVRRDPLVEGIAEVVSRKVHLYRRRRAAAHDYWIAKQNDRKRPLLSCQRVFPTRYGEFVDARGAMAIAKDEWLDIKAEMEAA